MKKERVTAASEKVREMIHREMKKVREMSCGGKFKFRREITYVVARREFFFRCTAFP